MSHLHRRLGRDRSPWRWGFCEQCWQSCRSQSPPGWSFGSRRRFANPRKRSPRPWTRGGCALASPSLGREAAFVPHSNCLHCQPLQIPGILINLWLLKNKNKISTSQSSSMTSFVPKESSFSGLEAITSLSWHLSRLWHWQSQMWVVSPDARMQKEMRKKISQLSLMWSAMHQKRNLPWRTWNLTFSL